MTAMCSIVKLAVLGTFRFERWKTFRFSLFLTFSITLALLLSACLEEPKLRTDTEDNFNTSFAAVTKDLSIGDRTKLDEALKDIVLVQVDLYGPTLNGKSFTLPSAGRRADSAENFTKRLTNAMTGVVEREVAHRWNEGRTKLVVQHARAIVDGRTARQVFLIADQERTRAIEAALVIYRDQLSKGKSALGDIHKEAEAAAQIQAERKTLLGLIEITKPRFTYTKSVLRDEPTVSFTITNKGSIPIKRIFMHGKLQTPGRAIPWIGAGVNYEFRGGLEPKETQALNLTPNMFSDWGKVPKEATNGAVLTLNLIAFEDPGGKRIGTSDDRSDSLSSREKALQDAIKELEAKISDLEAQLGQRPL
jgi:hypothetical protein